MENYLFLLLGIIVSCLINSVIVFQLIEERYERVYKNKILYITVHVGTFFGIIIINLIGIPILNMLSWLILFGIIVSFLYTEHGKKRLQRVLELFLLVVILIITETAGCVFLEFFFWKIHLTDIQPAMMQCLSMILSKLVIIIFYYAVISRIWKHKSNNRFTTTEYIVHAVIIIYSLVNLLIIIVVISEKMAISFSERLLLLINMLESAEKTSFDDRFVKMKLDSYNEFVVIHISNSSNGKCKWMNGRPISNKGTNHGIGILNAENIVKKYDGNMLLEEKKDIFCCDIIFNE